jgi:hypothetical protein
MKSTSTIDLSSDSNPDNEVKAVTLWDVKARKDAVYKVAYAISSGKRFNSPSLTQMREWLKVFVAEQPQDFFLNNSKQSNNFQLLVTACKMSHLVKTSRNKIWMVNFVADKLTILLYLHQQVRVRACPPIIGKDTVKHALTSTCSPPNDIPSIPWSPVVLPLWTPLRGLARGVSNGLMYLGYRTLWQLLLGNSTT